LHLTSQNVREINHYYEHLLVFLINSLAEPTVINGAPTPSQSRGSPSSNTKCQLVSLKQFMTVPPKKFALRAEHISIQTAQEKLALNH